MLDLSTVFATFPILETERLILRAATPEDAPDLFRIKGDPRVAHFLGRPPMASLEEALERVQDFRTTFQEQTGLSWVITHRTHGQVIGTCIFWHLNLPHFRAEVGYDLAPEWWGQGLIPEAVGAMLTFGFTRMGLHSVEAQIDPPNTGSRRVLEKLGFVQEGYFRENFYNPTEGTFGDTAVFSLLKDTWMSRTIK